MITALWWLLAVSLVVVGFILFAQGMWIFSLILWGLALAVGWVSLERTLDGI